ncbi:MAG: PaaI family thioesterase [Chloroflexi bacterium]|nr:PaaI family thioesterase [Chloroflexota bacterium]
MENHRTRTIHWNDPIPAAQAGMQMSGLDYIRQMIEGKFPPPPIAETLGFTIVEVAEGYAVFEGTPGEYLYNPIGVVHGGWAATLLDSAMGCAVHTTLEQGMIYTTLQININLVRPISLHTGKVRCEATVIHSGRRSATAEGKLFDENSKLLAHGSTTCIVMPLPSIE